VQIGTTRRVALVTLVLGAVVGAERPAAARADATVTAAADARVQQVTPTQNSGRGVYLRTDGDTGSQVESYLRFTVPALGGSVTKATLRLFTTDDGTSRGPSVYGTSNGWTETGITWNTRPTRTTGALSTLARAPASSWVEFDVTPFVTGSGSFSFDLATTSTDGVNFNSREAGTNPPQLVVTTGGAPPTATTVQPTSVTTTAATLNGTVDTGGQSTTYHFDYGPAATYGAQTPTATLPASSGPAPVSAPIGSLTAGTTYHYRLVATNASGTSAGADVSFTTARSDIVTVAAAGDIACPLTNACVSGARATAAVLGQIGPQAVLGLGDLQYWSGAPSEWAAYDSTWGFWKSITYPAPGNHEYLTVGAAGYYGYFGVAAGDPTKGYYSFDLGAWHLISLNSECSEIGGCGPGSPQATWLQTDLAAHPSLCTLAFWHRPRFASNTQYNDTNVQTFWNLLYAAGADVILNGHLHLYERFAPQTPTGAADAAHGMREFVVGTGGEGFATFNTVLANSEVRNANTYGVLSLTLAPASYSWQFVPTTAGGFTDSGSTNCH
jgi:hypothetical protein